MAVQSLYVEWADANGAFYRTRSHIPLAANPAALLAAEQALCNAGQQQETHGGVTTFLLTPPIAGTAYDTVFQVGQVSYDTVGGAGVRVLLPGLIKANLLADGIRINPAALAALDAAALATVTDNLGNLATARTSAVLFDRRSDQQ